MLTPQVSSKAAYSREAVTHPSEPAGTSSRSAAKGRGEREATEMGESEKQYKETHPSRARMYMFQVCKDGLSSAGMLPLCSSLLRSLAHIAR